MPRTIMVSLHPLTNILFMATMVSAMFLTLSNFETISSISVSLGCVFAYNTPMQGCNVNDFGDGNTCSGNCRGILSIIESNIQESCMLVDIGPGSLLDRAQNGDLVRALCGNKPQTEPGSAISRPPPGSFTRIPSDPPPTTATPTQSVASTTPVSSTPKVVATSASTPLSTRARESPPTTPSPDSTSTTPKLKEDTTEQPQTAPGSTTTTSSSTQEPPPPNRPPGSGGGSPFDPVIFGSSGTALRRPASLALLLVCGIGVYLGQR